MKERIKAVRASANLNQSAFGEAIGVTLSAVQKWELGIAEPRPAILKNIASRFGIREEWLRTGEGEMLAAASRASEMQAQVERLFSDDSAEFQQALISSLLAFDPRGTQWRVVEEIFRNVTERLNNTPAPAPPEDRASLHAELDRQLDEEEKGASQVS